MRFSCVNSPDSWVDQETVHRLSEANCVEIVMKLIEQGSVTLHKTQAGREWITPDQIQREVHACVITKPTPLLEP